MTRRPPLGNSHSSRPATLIIFLARQPEPTCRSSTTPFHSQRKPGTTQSHRNSFFWTCLIVRATYSLTSMRFAAGGYYGHSATAFPTQLTLRLGHYDDNEQFGCDDHDLHFIRTGSATSGAGAGGHGGPAPQAAGIADALRPYTDRLISLTSTRCDLRDLSDGHLAVSPPSLPAIAIPASLASAATSTAAATAATKHSGRGQRPGANKARWSGVCCNVRSEARL